jgi:hypothetical protein
MVVKVMVIVIVRVMVVVMVMIMVTVYHWVVTNDLHSDVRPHLTPAHP